MREKATPTYLAAADFVHNNWDRIEEACELMGDPVVTILDEFATVQLAAIAKERDTLRFIVKQLHDAGKAIYQEFNNVRIDLHTEDPCKVCEVLDPLGDALCVADDYLKSIAGENSRAGYARDRRAYLIAEGLCYRCGRVPPEEGRQACSECRFKAGNYYWQLIAAGKCHKCKGPLPDDYEKTACETCLATYRKPAISTYQAENSGL